MGYAFDEAVAVGALGDGRYDVALDERWHIGGALHGGYLLAVVSRAALADDPHPDLLAVSANFLRGPRPGPARALVERGRTGRRIGYVRVLLSQDGEACLDAVVTTGTLTEEQPVWTEESPVVLPDPDECFAVPAQTPGGSTVGIAVVQDARLDPRLPWLAGGYDGPPEMRAWARFADGRDPDSVSMAFFADSLPPVTFTQGRFGWVPTVHMSVLVRGRPAPGWCRIVMRGGHEVGGFLDEEVKIWDSAGRLVAHGHQLAASPRS